MPRWKRPPDREWPDTIDKAKIDAEPKRARGHYHVGAKCWFVETVGWFLCEVTAYANRRITIKPVTGKDAERQVDWPYGAELEFAADGNRGDPGTSLRLYDRLRPLKARRP